MEEEKKVTFEICDSIGIITIAHPPGNLLMQPEFVALEQLERWVSEPLLKGLIIRGEGRNFSAGGKLDLIFKASRNHGEIDRMMQRGHLLLNYIRDLEIPVVAAINRVCFGGGLEIALACHIRVASENALLAFPEVNHNLMPGMAGTVRLPLLAGIPQSIKIILGGDIVSANDAKKLGFIDYIAPADSAFEYSMALVQKMVRDRPVKVIRSIMKALKNTMMLSPDEAMKEETKLFCSLAIDESERRKTEGD